MGNNRIAGWEIEYLRLVIILYVSVPGVGVHLHLPTLVSVGRLIAPFTSFALHFSSNSRDHGPHMHVVVG